MPGLRFWRDARTTCFLEKTMPVLPLVDLLILMGWTSLFGAFALKAIAITTSYQPQLFGLGPLDLTILAAVFLLFSLALAARAWVRNMESQNAHSARDRAAATLDAYSAVKAEARRADKLQTDETNPAIGGKVETPRRRAQGA